MTTNTARRTLTSARVLTMITSAIVPQLGTNKLRINGQGNPYVRENGTAIHIFNVAAFASTDDVKAAADLWKEGTKLEKSGDIDGAQEKFREALNHQMSFSVLAENASDFQQAFEINCLVEKIKNSDGEEVTVINRPRAVAVEANGTSVADLTEFFKVEEDKPSTIKKSKKAKAA